MQGGRAIIQLLNAAPTNGLTSTTDAVGAVANPTWCCDRGPASGLIHALCSDDRGWKEKGARDVACIRLLCF